MTMKNKDSLPEKACLSQIVTSGVLTQSIMPFLAASRSAVVDIMCVSRDFQLAVDQSLVWETLALHRYGEAIVKVTKSAIEEERAYSNLKEAILKDNNARVAIATIRDPKVCNWDGNGSRTDAYYYCMIQGIKWDRSSKAVNIYFDARGEVYHLNLR